MNNIQLIALAVTLLAVLIGFVAGRISTAPKRGARLAVPLTDAQLALIAYETTRAYKIAHGDISFKSWNNVPRAQRASLVARVAAHRRRPRPVDRFCPPELQLQAAIIAIAVPA